MKLNKKQQMMFEDAAVHFVAAIGCVANVDDAAKVLAASLALPIPPAREHTNPQVWREYFQRLAKAATAQLEEACTTTTD